MKIIANISMVKIRFDLIKLEVFFRKLYFQVTKLCFLSMYIWRIYWTWMKLKVHILNTFWIRGILKNKSCVFSLLLNTNEFLSVYIFIKIKQVHEFWKNVLYFLYLVYYLLNLCSISEHNNSSNIKYCVTEVSYSHTFWNNT